MIAENAADLVARLSTVTAFGNRVAFALGGHGTDPGIETIDLPAAWLVFSGDDVAEDPYTRSSTKHPGLVPAKEVVLATFIAVIYVPYVDQADLFAVQFPLLESCTAAVKFDGGQAPSGHRWRYIKQKLVRMQPERLVYEQHYTLNWVI